VVVVVVDRDPRLLRLMLPLLLRRPRLLLRLPRLLLRLPRLLLTQFSVATSLRRERVHGGLGAIFPMMRNSSHVQVIRDPLTPRVVAPSSTNGISLPLFMGLMA
jgi:hypothetical protein